MEGLSGKLIDRVGKPHGVGHPLRFQQILNCLTFVSLLINDEDRRRGVADRHCSARSLISRNYVRSSSI